MKNRLNQSLLIRLEMLSLEPAGSCFSVQGEEGQGSFYVFNRRILVAAFGNLNGEDAVRALLDKKDCWVFENPEAFPDSSDLGIYVEAILVDMLQFGEEKGGDVDFPFSVRRQRLSEQYELNISVQGGPWDGHIFALFPGENPISKLAEAVRAGGDSTGSPTNCAILVGDSQAVLVDHGSGRDVWLNGTKTREAVLSPEDVITLGDVSMKLHYVVREPISIRVAAESRQAGAETEASRQVLREAKTINWKKFAPKSGGSGV